MTFRIGFPDADALTALSARLDDVPIEVAAALPEPEKPSLVSRLTAVWPAAAGPIVSAWASDTGPLRVRVTHLGPELGPVARPVLARSIAVDDTLPEIEEVALLPVTAEIGDEVRWLSSSTQLVERVRGETNIHLCITMPPIPAATVKRRGRPPDARESTQLVREAIQQALEGRANTFIADGPKWNIAPSLTACTL